MGIGSISQGMKKATLVAIDAEPVEKVAASDGNASGSAGSDANSNASGAMLLGLFAYAQPLQGGGHILAIALHLWGALNTLNTQTQTHEQVGSWQLGY